MTLDVPDVLPTIERLLSMESTFNSRTQSIGAWIDEHRAQVKTNLALTQDGTDRSDMQVLRIFFRELLMRNIVGEGGERILDALREFIQTKTDLTPQNYQRALDEAGYRWGFEVGSSVMTAVVAYFRDELKWNWQIYLEEAERQKEWNFPDDPLRNIKGIGPKVRDLALSNFNSNYAAFDLHVVRVVSRIGLVAYGWGLTAGSKVDFGTNPSIPENYLFLHRLFLRLAGLSNGRFTPVDLDRVFWYFGRSKCRAARKCASCPIQDTCLTGRQRQ